MNSSKFNWVDGAHTVAVLATLAATFMAFGLSREVGETAPVVTAHEGPEACRVELMTDEHGQRALLDATRTLVPIQPYARVLAGSTASRGLLLELVEPTRIAAVADYGLDQIASAHRFSGLATISDAGRVEHVLDHRPDLVVLHAMSSTAKVARLREAGFAVFDLGEQRGLDMFLDDACVLAALLEVPERGLRFARRFRERMRSVAPDISPNHRKRGMYLSMYGNRFFGGTRGTSFHDVLTYGGLIDAAADDFVQWPQYDVEQILALDPEVILTNEGAGGQICRHEALRGLGACSSRGLIVELPSAQLSEPGSSMLLSAEDLRIAVYGPKASVETAPTEEVSP